MKPAPYVPAERDCPSCGSQTWGLQVSGGPMFDKPAVFKALCYDCHTARPIRKIAE